MDEKLHSPNLAAELVRAISTELGERNRQPPSHHPAVVVGHGRGPDWIMTNVQSTKPTLRDQVRIAGPDATSYLQSQLSQDVAAMAVGASADSFLLQPNGKVVAWGTVHRIGDDEYRFETDQGAGEAIVARLERFKLRSKVTITAEGTVPGLDPWTRITAGIPSMGHEVCDATIPGELGAAIIDSSVSFTKGCYTGQELVARVDSRGGNVPKPIRYVAIEGTDVPPEGAELFVDDKASGTLTSVALGPDGDIVALAIVARRVVPPASVSVQWEGAQAVATVHELPS